MPKPRSAQVSLEATPYYHCTSRCVRRTYLCGIDPLTREDYEHRRQWLEDKLLDTADIFAIDICAYAIMSNHYHAVLHINKSLAEAWSFDEVIHQWHKAYSGSALSQRYLSKAPLGKAELATLKDQVEEWRDRLMSLSWFMRAVNEPIARQANAEDKCTGHFWEARFTSQAILDEAALAANMVYVDLNPIRAKMAETPEASDYTSIKLRIQSTLKIDHPDYKIQPKCLFPFVGNPRNNMPEGLPFELTDYIELVEETGRQLRAGKRGKIDSSLSPILERLNFEADNWLYLSRHFGSTFKGLVGSINKLKQACKKLGYVRTICKQSCEQYFP